MIANATRSALAFFYLGEVANALKGGGLARSRKGGRGWFARTLTLPLSRVGFLAQSTGKAVMFRFLSLEKRNRFSAINIF
jgi:hypothetical protein